MHKKISILSLIIFVSCVAVSVGYAKYVRKQLQPDFFMPESERFNQPEKIPKFIASVPKNINDKDDIIDEYEKIAEDVATEEDEQNKEGVEAGYNEVSEKQITPEFQNKYGEYSHDLEFLQKYKKLPQNRELYEDLGKMNSDNFFEVVTEKATDSEVSREFNKRMEEIIKD